MTTHREFVKLAFEPFIEKAKRTMDHECKVLDVGCKDDALRSYLEGKGFVWTGLDPVGGKDILNYKMEDMSGIEDNSYDLVFSCHSWEHCERPLDALKEFYRVCKPNGWVFIATPSPCDEQITKGDEDHIFVLNALQMTKLLKFTGWCDYSSYLQDDHVKEVRNWNVISVGKKE